MNGYQGTYKSPDTNKLRPKFVCIFLGLYRAGIAEDPQILFKESILPEIYKIFSSVTPKILQ